MAKDNVLQFPIDSKVKVDNTGGLAHEHMIFTENLVEALVVNMIHNLGENGIDIDSPDFLRDTAFLVELLKGMIYREGGLPHPLHNFTKLFVGVVEEEDGNSYLDIDLDMIQEISDEMGEFEDDDKQ
jgi:hypothetical protein|tara:strand:- start:634 stop:1014 length:381 start_codon:yes stop_codon:yes gene_type:complete